jgi:hypothetical protein
MHIMRRIKIKILFRAPGQARAHARVMLLTFCICKFGLLSSLVFAPRALDVVVRDTTLVVFDGVICDISRAEIFDTIHSDRARLIVA